VTVVTFSQARCDTARAVGWAFSFQLVTIAVNSVFSFAAFITARVTSVCSTIRSPCDETRPDVEEFEFVNDVRLIEYHFTFLVCCLLS